ncbi:MAG: helix-turn-helix domain-containing protein [Pyrinomonadaceae bacterium]
MRLLNSAAADRAAEANLQHAVTALESLAQALSLAVESLRTTRVKDIRQGINFYDEVSSFEIELIVRALRETGGQQRRAARLLGLNVSTLNAKIKHYGIDYAHLLATAPHAEAVGGTAGGARAEGGTSFNQGAEEKSV